ncbi:MAG: hypothetical protein IT445_19540 [Phycisphaeraceae bacterium]|nr:hypothetical protein [Phycisphaeraceae bacterium]
MAQITPSSGSAPPASGQSQSPPSFSTPAGIVLGALLLCLVGLVAASAAHVARQSLAFDDPSTRMVVAYLLYLPATFFFLVSMVALIVGAIRWAMYGKDALGPAPIGASANDAYGDLLHSINDRLLLSDTAKRIAYRQHDLAALRRAIREDIDKGQFDAAMVLVQEMSHTFGYREESELFREQITAARKADLEKKISVAMEHLNHLIANNDFRAAGLMAAKMARLYPDNERENNIVDYVEEMKEQYKARVQRDMAAARERGEVERAWQLLRELDGYLTPKEAEQFREMARDVIAKMRDNMGTQLRMAVENQEWHRAQTIAEQIIRDFPNTRMADEARSMLPQLRQRAAEGKAAHA